MADRLSVLDASVRRKVREVPGWLAQPVRVDDVYYGLNADRDAMSDVDTPAALIDESFEELVSTVPGQ